MEDRVSEVKRALDRFIMLTDLWHGDLSKDEQYIIVCAFEEETRWEKNNVR